jgi:hypothetical protein
MQKGPYLRITFQNDVTAPSSITAVRSAKSCKFIAQKMLASCTPMTAPAEYLDLVNKVAFIHCRNLIRQK